MKNMPDKQAWEREAEREERERCWELMGHNRPYEVRLAERVERSKLSQARPRVHISALLGPV